MFKKDRIDMTFQDMVKKDPQGNSTADHRTVDATGNFHLLRQPESEAKPYVFLREILCTKLLRSNIGRWC